MFVLSCVVSVPIYGHLMVVIGTILLSGRLFEFEWEGEGEGRLFEAGRLLTFSAFSLFKVRANSRLGAYSNKYGRSIIKPVVKIAFLTDYF